jgi:hypothetical protein
MRSAVDKLDSLVSTLPELSTAAQDFTKRTAAINKTRQQYVRTLKQHPNLLEILELPQLMGTCVRVRHVVHSRFCSSILTVVSIFIVLELSLR